jgi:hypothetical protein
MGSGEASHAFSEAVSERLLRDGSVCTHMCSLVGYLPPRVASVVVQDLLEDGGASALACAAHVIADLLAAGQINSQQENAYVTVARERLAQTPHDSDWLLVLGALAERRPRLIGHIIELDPESRRILDERSTVSAARASVYVRQLVEHVRRLAPRTLAAAEDDMVGPLMMEAIFHASFARRQDAAIALMCSPYRPAVAAAVDTALAQDDGSATAGLQQLASWVDDGYGPVPQV